METIWKAVTEADMQRTCMSPMLDALRQEVLAVGQADPLTGAIEDAVAETRAAVESCDENVAASDTTTVPPSLRAATCWIALAYLQKRISTLRLTQDQKDEIEEARGILKEVAACDRAVARASDPLAEPDVQRGGGATVVDPDETVRTTTRGQMDGLL